MEKYFTYKDKWSDEYHNCYFQVNHYENGNLAVEIWNNEEGPITRITVNPDIKISSKSFIAIKNYAENAGMVEWLCNQGLIEPNPVNIIMLGWVEIPVHRLTEEGMKAFGRED